MFNHTMYILQACTNKNFQLKVQNVVSKYAKLSSCSLILIKTYERADNCPQTGIYMVKISILFPGCIANKCS